MPSFSSTYMESFQFAIIRSPEAKKVTLSLTLSRDGYRGLGIIGLASWSLWAFCTSSAMIFFSCAGVNFMDICLSPAAGSSICIMESYERSGICLRPGGCGGLEVVHVGEVAGEVGG